MFIDWSLKGIRGDTEKENVASQLPQTGRRLDCAFEANWIRGPCLNLAARPGASTAPRSLIAYSELVQLVICWLKGRNGLLRKTDFLVANPWGLSSRNQLAQISAVFRF